MPGGSRKGRSIKRLQSVHGNVRLCDETVMRDSLFVNPVIL
jgi:hypothetical protein